MRFVIVLRSPRLFLTLLLAVSLMTAIAAPTPTQAQEPPFDLSVELSSTATGSWQIVARNHGTVDAFGVTVQLELPDQLRHDAPQAAASEVLVVNRDVGRLPAGGEKIIRYSTKLALNVPGTHENRLAVRGRAVISNTVPVESMIYHYNNASEAWISASTTGGAQRPAGQYIRPSVSINNSNPEDGDTVIFTVRRGFGDIDSTIIPHYRLKDSAVYGFKVRIQLPPGLDEPTETFSRSLAGMSFTAVPGLEDTWDWQIPVFTATPPRLMLAATVDNRAELEGECFTAELTIERPNDFDPSDNTAQICFVEPTPTLFQEGKVDIFTIYPCVGSSTPPCTTNDTVEIAAVHDTSPVDRILEPEQVFIQVMPPLGAVVDDQDNSVNSGGKVSWQTATDLDPDFRGTRAGVKIGYSRIPFNDELNDWESLGRGVTVSGLNNAAQPGNMSIRSGTSGNPIYATTPTSPTATRAPFSLERRSTVVSKYFAEFEKLGTYVVEYTATAARAAGADPTGTFVGSGTYTFHVGPVAELEVRDGGRNPAVPDGQRAFTVVAVNNGPDDPLGANVDVPLPAGAKFVRAIASTGDYDETTGTWDIDRLRLKDYYLSAGLPEGETLTIIVECPADGCRETTATISNDNVNHPYAVCIDSDGNDVDVTNEGACRNVIGASWHEGTVFDYIPDNNKATLRARRGEGELPPGAPREAEDTPFVPLIWRAVDRLNGVRVSHYQVWRSSCAALPSQTQTPVADDVTAMGWLDLDVDTGTTYCYQVRAVNVRGGEGPFSRVMEKTARAPAPLAPSASRAGAPDRPVLSAAALDGQERERIRLKWDKPNENGWPIISYTLEASDTGRANS